MKYSFMDYVNYFYKHLSDIRITLETNNDVVATACSISMVVVCEQYAISDASIRFSYYIVKPIQFNGDSWVSYADLYLRIKNKIVFIISHRIAIPFSENSIDCSFLLREELARIDISENEEITDKRIITL